MSKKSSSGENLIESYLIANKYNYIKEFEVTINERSYWFDFAILNNGKLSGFIEFDGEQHYIPVAEFGGQKCLKNTRRRDILKNKYCEDSGLTLLRISYRNKNKAESIIHKKFGEFSNQKKIVELKKESKPKIEKEKIHITFNELKSMLKLNIVESELRILFRYSKKMNVNGIIYTIYPSGKRSGLRIENTDTIYTLICCQEQNTQIAKPIIAKPKPIIAKQNNKIKSERELNIDRCKSCSHSFKDYCMKRKKTIHKMAKNNCKSFVK